MDAMRGHYAGMAMQGFNPRARDGRDKQDHKVNQIFLVSIHAPVMDAIS